VYAVIGLGNPGTKYRNTRHNLGVWAVERLAESLQASSFTVKGGCLFQRVEFETESLLFLLPQTFMNRSGEAAQPLLHYYKITADRVIVVYDELDLQPGVLRLKRGGSAGGHRGVEDLIRHLGTQDFFRVRIGIGHPRRSGLPQMDASDWVLGVPSAEDMKVLRAGSELAAEAVKTLVSEGLAAAQTRFHGRLPGAEGEE
jgi:PTH1 family peptidyl-tRNA hydrolase